MNKRITVIAFEGTKDTSQRDVEEFMSLLELLETKYNFRWSITNNPNWIRELANEVEKKAERKVSR